MNNITDNNIEMQLIIDDLWKTEDFYADEDYPDAGEDEMNEVHISIVVDKQTIAYMEATIYYENRIDDLEMFADSISGDAFDAMCALNKKGLLDQFDFNNNPLDEISDYFNSVIVHINYMAVRDDYRGQGIGDWLFRNLPRILQRNYGALPRIISTTICPQVITWDGSSPSFSSPEDDETVDKTANKVMRNLMAKLLTKNGYRRLGRSDHYYVQPLKLDA